MCSDKHIENVIYWSETIFIFFQMLQIVLENPKRRHIGISDLENLYL